MAFRGRFSRRSPTCRCIILTLVILFVFSAWFILTQIRFDLEEKSLFRKIKLVKNSWFERQFVGSWIQSKLLALKWENYVQLYCTTEGKTSLALGKDFNMQDYLKYTKVVGEQLGFEDGHSLFDNGCGCGAFLSAFNRTYKDVRVGGLDLSSGAIDFAKKIFPSARDNFKVGSVEQLSFVKDAQYDHAMTFFTFPYVSPQTQCQAVMEMLRIVKPGGSLYIGHNLETECQKNHIGIYTLPLCFWTEKCLNDHHDVQEIYYMKERELFGAVKYCPEKTAVFIYKKGNKLKKSADTRRYVCNSKFKPSGRETTST